jgi:hypothetical protein
LPRQKKTHLSITTEKRRLNALKKAQVMSDREKNALSDGVKKGKKS